MSELLPYIKGERVGRVVGITFDDGYLNNLTHAAPVLKAFEFSSTCYVVSDLMGTTNSWDAQIGVPSAALMSKQELLEWIGAGQEVGSHTRTHAHLTQLSSVLAHEEIVSSKTQLELSLGVPVHQFCYPYGEYDSSHINLVRGAGYWAATTTKRGRVVAGVAHKISRAQNQLPHPQPNPQPHPHPQPNPFELHRVPIVRSTSWLQFILKIATSYEDHHKN